VDSFFHEDLRLGFGFTAPLPGLVTVKTWYNDEREQYFSDKLHFERFGEFDSAMTFYPGISFAPLEWLSLGFTLQVDLMLDLDSKLFLTKSTEWEYSYLNTGGEVRPLARPIGGVAVRTPIGLGLGIVYRHESFLDVKVDIDMRVWNGERLDEDTGELQLQFKQSHRNVLGYKPRELSVGLSYVRGILTAEITPTWEMWSGYLDRHGNNWSHPTWDEGDDTAAQGWDSDWKDPVFGDVISVRGGAEVRVSRHAAVRAGAAYFPSPMPPQTGRYNYVDNDMTMYSLGAGFRFEVLGRIVTADVAAQLWHMHSLTVKKNDSSKEDGGIIDEVPDTITDFDGVVLEDAGGLQTNNPGFPGYELGGLSLNLSLTLGVKFD
jgi:long-subunit fatty acid transport protein